MTISSRTPEGEPARCPLCNADIVIEPSVFFGDATCPNCGQLIWFLQSSADTHLFARTGNGSLRDRILNRISEQLNVPRERIPNNPSFLADIGADSLDTVELVMELEEEFNTLDDRPDNYEWWIDSLQDCLCQISGRPDGLNALSNACRHVCDETYIDLSHFVQCVVSNGYNDVPTADWRTIVDLSKSDDLESADAKSRASTVLDSAYFRNRQRWPYAG